MKMPRSFWGTGLLLLLWNLMGVVAFAMQYSADLTALARTDPYTARIFAAMSGWAWMAYATAVGAGTLGAILLLLRRAAAVPLFLLSIVGVIVQFGYSFIQTDLLAVKGVSAAVFPAVILIVALFQWHYARRQAAAGIVH